MEKAPWSPSPQDGYVEHLERELMKRAEIGPVKVVNARTAEVMKVTRITKTPAGTVIEVE